MENPNFEFHFTADGSPTLSQDASGEWMHHRQGAFSETLYVYGEALERVLAWSEAPRFISVGLGLGYVELLLAARALQHGCEFYVRSFESVPRLRDYFLAWVTGGPGTSEDFTRAYEAVSLRMARAFDVAPEKIRGRLQEWAEKGQWVLDGALDLQTRWPSRFEGIFYDAFSSETSPLLWKREILNSVLEGAAAPRSVFATYAATGELKRCLEQHRFRLEERAGFSGKRESTLALRP